MFIVRYSVIAVLLLLGWHIQSFSLRRKHLEDDVKKFNAPNWKYHGAAKSTDIITPVFLIKRDDIAIAKFEKQLLELSDPNSPKYGQWLSKQQIITQFAPSLDKLALVQNFLDSYNIPSRDIKVSDFQDKIFVKMNVSIASQMFQTTFGNFGSTIQANTTLIRVTTPYSLPVDVAKVVALVDDLVRLPSVKSTLTVAKSSPHYQRKSSSETHFTTNSFGTCTACPSSFVTPSVLQQAYTYTPLTSTAAPGNSVAVAEFQGSYYDQPDLNNFNTGCGTSVSPIVATYFLPLIIFKYFFLIHV